MELSDDEKKKLEHQVEHFIAIVQRRWGLTDDREIIAAIDWYRSRKAMHDKVISTGIISLISLILSALALAVWEGVKSMLQGNR